MDAGGSKKMRTRELPPLPQRGQRTLPTTPSQDAAAETSTSGQVLKQKKKKRVRKEASGGDDVSDPGVELGGLVVGERLSLEPGTDAPPQRRRRKKKAATSDPEADRADLLSGDAADQTTDGEEGVEKAPRNKKTKVVASQLPDNDLDVEEDDIIAAGPPPPGPQRSLSSAPLARSQAGGKVFVERTKRFQAAERSAWRKSSDQRDNMADSQHAMRPLWTTRDVSLRVHQGFRVLGLCGHGVLAGGAMWNVGVVYLLAGQQLGAVSNLLEQYHGLAHPAQSLLYLLLALSTVAAFDRVNLARSSTALQELVTLNPVALASFLYFSALVLSLSQQMTSDRIHLYPDRNATLWPPGSEHHILHPWVTVNLVVAVLVGLAWIFISTRPETDYTQEYLESMRLEPLKPEDQSEMTA